MTEPIPTRDAYSEWAKVYDSNENRTRDLDAVVLRTTELPLDGADVIELGAGTGKNTEYLASRAASVLALDLSPAMLERARARGLGDHVRFTEHDITRPWPCADAVADLVVGNLVLEHVDDLAPVYAEIGRALKPGGLLFICELHPDRQMRGSRAQFERNGKAAFVEAYVHSVSDYVAGAEAAGLVLTGLNEAIEAGAEVDEDTPPRLLALTFSKPL